MSIVRSSYFFHWCCRGKLQPLEHRQGVEWATALFECMLWVTCKIPITCDLAPIISYMLVEVKNQLIPLFFLPSGALHLSSYWLLLLTPFACVWWSRCSPRMWGSQDYNLKLLQMQVYKCKGSVRSGLYKKTEQVFLLIQAVYRKTRLNKNRMMPIKLESAV